MLCPVMPSVHQPVVQIIQWCPVSSTRYIALTLALNKPLDQAMSLSQPKRIQIGHKDICCEGVYSIVS